MPRATMTSKGQITVPKEVRERLDLRTGDQVEFVLTSSGEAVLRPASVSLRDLKGLLARPGQKAVSVDQMNRTIKRRFSKE